MTFARFVSIGLTLLTLVTFSSQTLVYENDSPAIPLRTRENTIINVNRDIAEISGYLKNVIDDYQEVMGAGEMALAITLPIKEAVLRKVFHWCDHHYNLSVVEADHYSPTETQKKITITPSDHEFMEHIDFQMLSQITIAAHNLGFNELSKIGNLMIDDRVNGKSLEEIADMFNSILYMPYMP